MTQTNRQRRPFVCLCHRWSLTLSFHQRPRFVYVEHARRRSSKVD